MSARTVGPWQVLPLSDGTLDLADKLVTGLPAAEVAGLRRGTGPTSVNAFLLQREGRRVLVDAGSHAGMAPGVGRLHAALAQAGIAPESIGLVLLTHVHPDHAGGLLDEAGAPRFPRAEVALAVEEAAHWLSDAARDRAPEAARAQFDHARAWLAPYRLRRLGAGPVADLPGVSLVPLPGHTPGHSGYRIAAGAEGLLIWGDIMHIPAVQAPHPEAAMVFDADPALAVATRRALLAELARSGQPVAGMHIDFPGFATIAREGGGYALRPAAV